ncbi:hypothetical protein ACGF0D_19690 [Kitasatospora sp. NPDC048298]|uniref:hypothetical protein n=1 Tax=Kitasatospora sp. NPDC048298 TaxID=3364049 RepID=UPI00370F9DB0
MTYPGEKMFGLDDTERPSARASGAVGLLAPVPHHGPRASAYTLATRDQSFPADLIAAMAEEAEKVVAADG